MLCGLIDFPCTFNNEFQCCFVFFFLHHSTLFFFFYGFETASNDQFLPILIVALGHLRSLSNISYIFSSFALSIDTTSDYLNTRSTLISIIFSVENAQEYYLKGRYTENRDSLSKNVKKYVHWLKFHRYLAPHFLFWHFI